MAHRIPIFKDDLSFAERQGKVWTNMERDIERRRKEWEDEIERMRKDFFTLKPDHDGRLEKLTDKFKMGDKLVDDARGVVEKDSSGNPVFRVRFNVQDYTPDEVNVKMDTNKVIVNAKHEQKDGNKSVSREYSREVDIPREIDPMTLQCTISTDGVLSVEAPMPAPGYQAIKDGAPRPPPRMENVIHSQSSSSVSSSNQGQPIVSHQTYPQQSAPPQQQQPQPQQSQQQQHSQQQQKQPLHSSTFTTFLSGAASPASQPQQQPQQSPQQPPPKYQQSQTSNSPPASQHSAGVSNSSFSLQEAERRFKVEVDIEDFKPEELNVKTVDKKLVISARREEKIGNRSSSKELNREIHLPETVDPYAVKAYFSDSGKLFIEAPYVRSVPITHYNEGRDGSPHHVGGMAGR